MKKWKKCLVATVLLASFVSGGMTVSAATNMEQAQDIKVFVGVTSENNSGARSSLKNERMQLIESLAENSPQEEELAVITFSEYLTAEEADAYVSNLGECEVREVFLGIPGVDGRAIIGCIEADTIVGNIASNFEKMIESETNLEMREVLLDYQNDAQVFALTVLTTNAQILEASQMEQVTFVDVFNDPDAEAEAISRNAKVSYIAVPEKPDNTH